MPVGTRATVTGLDPEDLRRLAPPILLANTYHLLLRPGVDLFRRVGGIHAFMGWPGPVLTDSGGYQIFSLPGDRTLTEEGARFLSYIDGQPHLLSPERSIEVQSAIGSDIMMVLDECLPSTAEPASIRAAMDRTHRWALRSLACPPARGSGAVRHRARGAGPGDAAAVGGLPDRAPLRGVRHRGAGGRGHPGAAGRGDRPYRRPAARRPPALHDGGGHAARSAGGDRLGVDMFD